MMPAVLVPLAHGGHLLIDVPVFLGPVLAVSLWLIVIARRDRRRSRRRGGA